MEIQEYLNKKKELHKCLLEFMDHGKTIFKEPQLIKYLEDPKLQEDKYDLEATIRLILAIVKDHHRCPDFFTKIDQIVIRLKDQMIKNFTNNELFNIFKAQKRVLLFLIKENVIKLDQPLVNSMKNEKFSPDKYLYYFSPEIKNFVGSQFTDQIQQDVKKLSNHNFGVFDQKRSIGENDEKICQIIRNDSIDEFKSFVKQANLPLTSQIEPSIFETNSFLNMNQPTLIEYSAFFGSIQIFKYLQSNGIELTPSIWLYAIHGNNFELINLLKDSQVKPSDQSYVECLGESIKCHHIEITNFIQNNFFSNQKIDDLIFAGSAKYNNYILFPDNNNNIYLFYLACQTNNLLLVKMLLKCADVKNKINTKVILIINYFNKIKTFFYINLILNQLFFECNFKLNCFLNSILIY